MLPQGVQLLALTATATKSLRLSVTCTPGMIALSPCKLNLAYTVGEFTTVRETFKPLLDTLRKDRDKCPRTIVYCQSFNTCGDIYMYLTQSLGHECIELVDVPNIPRFRLVDMYISVTDQHHKDSLIAMFTRPSQLRVVIATIAFGLVLIALM